MNDNIDWPNPGDSLSRRVVRGGIWVFAVRITNRFRSIRMMMPAKAQALHGLELIGVVKSTITAFDSFYR